MILFHVLIDDFLNMLNFCHLIGALLPFRQRLFFLHIFINSGACPPKFQAMKSPLCFFIDDRPECVFVGLENLSINAVSCF